MFTSWKNVAMEVVVEGSDWILSAVSRDSASVAARRPDADAVRHVRVCPPAVSLTDGPPQRVGSHCNRCRWTQHPHHSRMTLHFHRRFWRYEFDNVCVFTTPSFLAHLQPDSLIFIRKHMLMAFACVCMSPHNLRSSWRIFVKIHLTNLPLEATPRSWFLNSHHKWFQHGTGANMWCWSHTNTT
jgi:hypothetical protein